MEIFLQYILPSLIALVVAVVAGIFGYLQVKTTIKKNIEAIDKEHKLSNQDHIKRLHYEERFKIYKDLNEKLLLMIIDALSLFPPGLDTSLPQNMEDRIKEYRKRYNAACTSFNEFTKSLYGNGPFIEEDVFKKLMEIREKCNLQIVFYPSLVMAPDKTFEKENAKNKSDCWLRGSQLRKDLDEITAFMRNKIKEEELF